MIDILCYYVYSYYFLRIQHKNYLTKHADSISNNYQCRGLLDHIKKYMLICMDVFILFVDGHIIVLDEIYMEFS